MKLVSHRYIVLYKETDIRCSHCYTFSLSMNLGHRQAYYQAFCTVWFVINDKPNASIQISHKLFIDNTTVF